MEPISSTSPIAAATKERIIKELGMLDDIPYELANTVSNIYYRIYLVSLERNNTDLTKLSTHDDEVLWLFDAYEKLLKIIPKLREIPLGTEYDMTVNYLLAKFKYRIKNADKKSYVRLKVELFNKKAYEIPNLARIIGIV